MVYLKSVENVITLGKMIGLLFLFCLPLLSILFLKTKRNDLTRPCNGNHFSSYINLIKSIIINKVDYNNSYNYVCMYINNSIHIYLLCMI